VYLRFVEKYPEPVLLARETPHDLLKLTGTLGLRWRAPLMIEAAKLVAAETEPRDDEGWLQELPGVGPYAAAAYLSLHRGIRAVIIDANIVRLLGRVFGFRVNGETRRKGWLKDLAADLTPQRDFRNYNYAVLDLAMTVCRSKPACSECPLLKGLCHFAGCRRGDHQARRIRSAASRTPTRGTP
jgi:A/G-specific adenine glycosylase